MCEQKFRELFYSNQKSVEFFDAFGEDLITEILVSGLIKSFDLYFREERFEDRNYRTQCLSTLNEIQSAIQQVYRGRT